MRLSHKVAIITGGSRGISFASADNFSQKSAIVILTASSQPSANKTVVFPASDEGSYITGAVLSADGMARS